MRRRTILSSVLIVVIAAAAAMAHARQEGADAGAIRRVIEDAYVPGVFVTRDEAAVRRGFHPDFILSARQDTGLMYINGTHVYTDYMGLYRFDDGWKIVNKVYEDHD